MQRCTCPAFSLIELLVVISVIAVLIAILIPALETANQVARSTQCIANQKQLGVAVAVYGADFREYLPYAHWMNVTNGQISDVNYGAGSLPDWGAAGITAVGDWDTQYNSPLGEYMNMDAGRPMNLATIHPWYTQVLPKRLVSCPGVTNAKYIDYWPSIGMNNFIATDHENPWFHHRRKVDDLKNPAGTYLFGDRGYYPDDQVDGLASSFGGLNQFIAGSWYAFHKPRHLGKINVLYVDGHGESLEHGDLDSGPAYGPDNDPWGEW